MLQRTDQPSSGPAPDARDVSATADTPASLGFDALSFSNRFAQLKADPAAGGPAAGFGSTVPLQPLPDPYLVAASEQSAALIGLDVAALGRPSELQVLVGNRVPSGAQPLASVYAGHQFGHWAGRLGDGRALLVGEVAGRNGSSWELQLKGAGKTPYSRMGDGRAVLRSSIREYLCSEAMAALGIPTTRALAVVGSDQPVLRETVETAAVVMRMAPSFVRFGHFEYFAHFDQHAALRTLADYIIDRYEPELAQRAPAGQRDGSIYADWLASIARSTAQLIARWQAVGFCHGVMNTDNMSILGLTIDYGPFGFLDGFDANHICNHSDDQGRYAYSMQPRIGEWNCYALGQALMPLIGDVDQAQQALAAYSETFASAWASLQQDKLGLRQTRPDDAALFDALFQALHASRTDFTLFFRALAQVNAADRNQDDRVRDLFIDREAADAWLAQYRARLTIEPRPDAERAAAMNAVNPLYVLRNHLAEIAIRRARGETADGTPSGPPDYSEVARLAQVLAQPFDERPGLEAYAAAPPLWASKLSVSCSS
jgi:uncharacterized protein YdiU (UPF0061 family)